MKIDKLIRRAMELLANAQNFNYDNPHECIDEAYNAICDIPMKNIKNLEISLLIAKGIMNNLSGDMSVKENLMAGMVMLEDLMESDEYFTDCTDFSDLNEETK